MLQGNFSEKDPENWTPELQKALNFDLKSAIRVDNGKISESEVRLVKVKTQYIYHKLRLNSLFLGVFWIDWKSLLHFYDVLYINWNPKLFSNRYVLHS